MAAKSSFLILLLSTLGSLGFSEQARAGWVSVKNETKQTIIIQEVGGTILRPVRGKCIRLQPGETYREFHAAAGEKTVLIFDSADLTKPLLNEKLSWKIEDPAYRLETAVGKIKLAAGPAPTATIPSAPVTPPKR